MVHRNVASSALAAMARRVVPGVRACGCPLRAGPGEATARPWGPFYAAFGGPSAAVPLYLLLPQIKLVHSKFIFNCGCRATPPPAPRAAEGAHWLTSLTICSREPRLLIPAAALRSSRGQILGWWEGGGGAAETMEERPVDNPPPPTAAAAARWPNQPVVPEGGEEEAARGSFSAA